MLLHKPSNDCKRDWSILCDLYEKNRDKIDHIGVSNYDINHLEQLEGMPQPFVNQVELSIFFQRTKLVNYCRDKNILIISHTTLTRGLKFDNPVIVDLIDKYKTTAAKLLLKWATQNGFIVIPRTCNFEHLLENIEETTFEYSKEDMTMLNELDENFALTKVMY